MLISNIGCSSKRLFCNFAVRSDVSRTRGIVVIGDGPALFVVL